MSSTCGARPPRRPDELGTSPRHVPACGHGRRHRASRGGAHRPPPPPALEDPPAAHPDPADCRGRGGGGAADDPAGFLRHHGPDRGRRAGRGGGRDLVRCPVPALADHHLRAHHPPPPAARGHPVPVRPRLPADQDQRRLVLARADRPAARLRPARGRIGRRARAARPRPRSRRSRRCRPPCSSWSRTSTPGWPGRSPEPDRRGAGAGLRWGHGRHHDAAPPGRACRGLRDHPGPAGGR